MGESAMEDYGEAQQHFCHSCKRMFEHVMEEVGHKPILQEWIKQGGSTDYWPLKDDESPLGPPIHMDRFG